MEWNTTRKISSGAGDGRGRLPPREIANFLRVKQKLQWEIINKRKMVKELSESLENMRRLYDYLRESSENDRMAIAREIHDELGQALSALKLNTNWLYTHLPQEQKALRQRVKAISDIIDSTLFTVRRICTDLRPGILDDLGIVAALEWQSRSFQNMTGIKCVLRLSVGDIDLDQNKSTCLFRIYQETLTNIIRHAEATEVKVDLVLRGKYIILRVKDNGLGISEEKVRSPDSFGLLGMMERARSVGGSFHIKGLAGKGTTVTVKIPLGGDGKT